MSKKRRQTRKKQSGGEPRPKLTPIKAVIALAAVVAVLVGLYYGMHFLEHSLIQNEDTKEEVSVGFSDIQLIFTDEDYEDYEYICMDAIETYLIMGTDNRGRGYETLEAASEAATESDAATKAGNTETLQKTIGDPADFMMLLVIDRTKDTYGYLQLDRNTMMWVPMIDENGNDGPWAYQQLCLAHCYGPTREHNCSNTVQAVSELLGDVPIDGYYCIDMGGIGQINALVGGVEVTLDEDFTDLDPEMKAGATLNLNDKQAEIYVRGRMGLTDETNAGRMNRQRQYLNKYFEKVQKKIDEDPDFATEAYESLGEHVTSDLPGSNISKLAKKMSNAESLGILKLEGDTVIKVSETDEIEHEQFTPDFDSIIEVMTTLYSMETYEEADYGVDEEDTEYIDGDDIEEDDTEEDDI